MARRKAESTDWGNDSHSIAFSYELSEDKLQVHLILNGYWGPLDFELPAPKSGKPWRRWIDTSLPSPDDIVEWQSAPELTDHVYPAAGRSVIVLYTAFD